MDPSIERARVSELDAGEFEAAIGLLSRAFRDNPLNRAVIGAASSPALRLRCNAAGMAGILEVARGRGLLLGVRDGGALVGALVATPPYAWPLPPPGFTRQARILWAQGLRVASRWHQVFERLERRHPHEPHWYVGVLGVDPPHQGRGFGAATLREATRRADADALPTYLETDREENLVFYGRAGFAVVEEIEVLATRIWCLRRAPSAQVLPSSSLR